MLTRFVLFSFILLFAGTTVHAQSTVYKATDGVVLLSSRPGCYFTLDIAGEAVVPAGMDSGPNPMFMADNKFLQVISVRGSEFGGTSKMTDEEFLRRHLAYETGHHKIPLHEVKVEVTPLAKGQTVLIWSATPKMPKAKEQVFLTLRSRDYAIVLGSAVSSGFKLKDIRAFLLKTARTFHRANRPMSLTFLENGTYQRFEK